MYNSHYGIMLNGEATNVDYPNGYDEDWVFRFNVLDKTGTPIDIDDDTAITLERVDGYKNIDVDVQHFESLIAFSGAGKIDGDKSASFKITFTKGDSVDEAHFNLVFKPKMLWGM